MYVSRGIHVPLAHPNLWSLSFLPKNRDSFPIDCTRSQIKYSPDDVMHRRLIQTIYRRMTNEKRTCPNVGPHWDVIGFQGNDPCTDLNRSMGVFALFQVRARVRVNSKEGGKRVGLNICLQRGVAMGHNFICIYIQPSQ